MKYILRNGNGGEKMNYDFFNIDNSIEELVKNFKKISRKGWFLKKARDNGEAGNKFEFLLGKSTDNLQVPDFYGIEIKTKKINSSDNYITLFNAVPYGRDFFEIDRLKNEYGYPDSDLRDCNVLNGDIFCKNKNRIGAKFYFQSQIDNKNQKINLLIFNRFGKLIDNYTFWPFETIKEKLYFKVQYLALINVRTKRVNGKQYYKYEDIEIFKIKNFESFIKAIQNDFIRIQLKIGVFKSGKRFGQTHDRGTGFQINQKHINYIYDKIYSSKKQ